MGNERLVRHFVSVLIVGLVTLAGAAGAQPAGGDPERGERVFRAECAMCHGSDARGMMGMHPSLRGAVERLSAEGVEVTIRRGRATMPPMPAFEDRLSDQEIAAVIGYLDALPPGPRNFGPDGGGGGMGDMMPGPDGVHGVVGWLLGVLVVFAVLAVVLLVARQRRPAGAGSVDARAVLDRRYAAGELNREEYLERRRDLDA